MLALEQAGAYITHRRCSLADYRQQWQARREAVSGWHDERVMNYPASVAVTWQTTIDHLTPGQLALLQLLAWFDAEPIPTWVFDLADAEWVWRDATATLPAYGEPAGELFDALASLAGFSMARSDAEAATVSVHRLVQQILRDRMGDDTARWVNDSAQLVNAALPEAPGDVRTWERWEPLRPHVAATIGHAEQVGIAEPTSRLMNQLGPTLVRQGAP